LYPLGNRLFSKDGATHRMIFEVRMTAFERPALLRRALESLLVQTHTGWRANVMDDSRSAAISELVATMDDDRIVYSHNPERLGAAGNIDQCFLPEALQGGNYACLLEDDNYWLPDFLANIATILADHPWDLVLANQRIHDEDTGLRPEAETTRGAWFGGGAVDPLELRASVLLMEGLSNGGLVWRITRSLPVSARGPAFSVRCRSECRLGRNAEGADCPFR
jgi:GT2 family glycosyltransferase